MKKIFITTAIAFSAVALASAQEVVTSHSVTSHGAIKMEMHASTTASTTGNGKDGAIGQQMKALRMEMEAKIKAIRAEYELKIRALVGNKGQEGDHMDTSSTTPHDKNHDGEDKNNDSQGEKKGGHGNMRATSTKSFSALLDMFKGYFGVSVEAGQ